MNNKYKLCIITTVSTSIKAFFIKQIRYLNENGYDVTVICNDDRDLEKFLGKDIKYIPINMKRGIDIFGFIKIIVEMYKIFKINKFDIIQYSTPNASLYASIAGTIAKIKVRNYHNMGYRYISSDGIKRFILKLLEQVTCRLSTHIENVSQSNLEFGIKEGLFSYNKSCIVWNGSTGGVNLKKFDIGSKFIWKDEIHKKYNIDREAFIFGFVGRITKDKGINELLEAFKSLDKYNDIVLMIVGEEEDLTLSKNSIYEWAKKRSNIIFVGKTDEVYKFLATFDVLILASYREGFGNVIIESQAMGTPVIVSNIPGPIDAIKNNITGVLIEPRDKDSLLIAMINLYKEREKTINMGKEGRKFVEMCFNEDTLMHHILDRKNKLVKL